MLDIKPVPTKLKELLYYLSGNQCQTSFKNYCTMLRGHFDKAKKNNTWLLPLYQSAGKKKISQNIQCQNNPKSEADVPLI